MIKPMGLVKNCARARTQSSGAGQPARASAAPARTTSTRASGQRPAHAMTLQERAHHGAAEDAGHGGDPAARPGWAAPDGDQVGGQRPEARGQDGRVRLAERHAADHGVLGPHGEGQEADHDVAPVGRLHGAGQRHHQRHRHRHEFEHESEVQVGRPAPPAGRGRADHRPDHEAHQGDDEALRVGAPPPSAVPVRENARSRTLPVMLAVKVRPRSRKLVASRTPVDGVRRHSAPTSHPSIRVPGRPAMPSTYRRPARWRCSTGAGRAPCGPPPGVGCTGAVTDLVTTALSGVWPFAVTNVDDLVVLAALFVTVGRGRPSVRQIVIGQYLGIGVLVAISVLVAVGLAGVPERWIGMLGLVPLALGLRGLVLA